MYDRIAVPLDGSGFGDYAIRFATEIAKRSNARLRLIHVHVPRHVEHGLFGVATFRHRVMAGSESTSERELFEAEQRALAEKAVAVEKETGLEVTSHIVGGSIGDAVEREAEAWDADLIVMATHARTGLERIRHGSIADEVVRKAVMPVLLVRPPENQLSRPITTVFRRIMATLDGSSYSEQVLPTAQKMAELFGASLYLAHVETPPGDRFFVGDASAEAAMIAQYRQVGRRYLEDVRERAAGGALKNAQVEPIVGRFATVALLEAAVRLDVDLICMATHGRGGLSRALIGSTANEVLAHTWLPVLLHRPTLDDADAVPLEAVISANGSS